MNISHRCTYLCVKLIILLGDNKSNYVDVPDLFGLNYFSIDLERVRIFNIWTKTLIFREAINRLCEIVPGGKGVWRKKVSAADHTNAAEAENWFQRFMNQVIRSFNSNCSDSVCCRRPTSPFMQWWERVTCISLACVLPSTSRWRGWTCLTLPHDRLEAFTASDVTISGNWPWRQYHF